MKYSFLICLSCSFTFAPASSSAEAVEIEYFAPSVEANSKNNYRALPPLFEPGTLHKIAVRGQSDDPFDEPLVTDRPDFTESSSTVGFGVTQIEMGYRFTYNDDDTTGNKTHSHTAPEILFRYGFLEDVELRLGWTYGWNEEVVGAARSRPDGGSDFGVGFKIDLFEQCCSRPEQAIIIGSTLPTGANTFSSNKVSAGVTYAYSWELANEWSLGANSGFFTDRENGDDFTVWLQSVALSIPLNECWGMYIEYYGLYEADKVGAVDQNYLDGGITWLWSNNLQFDFSVGFGLNDDAEDFYSGLGTSIRF